MDLSATLDSIYEDGPTRVMPGTDGETYSAAKSFSMIGKQPDIIFVRNDGWSLGAFDHNEADAYEVWSDAWIGFIRRGMPYEPIEGYTVPNG